MTILSEYKNQGESQPIILITGSLVFKQRFIDKWSSLSLCIKWSNHNCQTVFAAPHAKHDNISISQNFIVIMKITELIRAWMADSSNNFIEPGSTVPAFAEPLVGISSGKDDLFIFLKTDIGPDHYLDSAGSVFFGLSRRKGRRWWVERYYLDLAADKRDTAGT